MVDGTPDLEQVKFYYDPFDGGGLRQYGSTPLWLFPSSIKNVGDIGDYVVFWSGSNNLTGDTLGFTFEEVQLYSGMLTPSEINDLRYEGQPYMLGKWNFNMSGTLEPNMNKAPAGEWSPLSLTGTGAAISDGKLVLPRYDDGGTWRQSSASTMLQTDLGAGGYFTSMTQVAWVKWSGFDPGADYCRLTALSKFSSPAYQLGNKKASQSLAFNSTDSSNWGSDRLWEYVDGGGLTTGSSWEITGGPQPPTDRFIKIAQVLRLVEGGDYELTNYWDIGSGLVQLGSPVAIPASEVNAFGQKGSDCIVDASGGPRYDGFGIMDWAWSVPQSAGQIEFDEVRLYANALDVADIDELVPDPDGVGRLVGHWTFDEYAGTGPLSDKVPDVSWGDLVVDSYTTISDGQIHLTRYNNGTSWVQSRAYAPLNADLGPENYFKEMTQVAWLKWPGFDTASTWARLACISKMPSTTFDLGQSKAAQGIVMNAASDDNWYGYRQYEYLDGGVLKVGGQWALLGGSDPPTDRLIKIAQVLRWKNSTQYEQVMYWDIGDGNGLVQVGQPAIVWSAWVNAFGQSGTNCLVDPSGGPRYDFFGIMDYSWQVPQSAGQIDLDEVRLYAGALNQASIAALTPKRKSPAGMFGHWTFDNYLGSGELSNKAPGVTWANMALTGSGAVVADGRLVLPRYLSGTWKQSMATTMLATDLGIDRYSREVTRVMWIHWPGFASNDAFQRVLVMIKNNAGTWNINPGVLKADDGIAYDARAATNNAWVMHEAYEKPDDTVGGNWLFHYNNLIDPPKDRLIKVAQVVKYLDTTKYVSLFYVDYDDGAGLKLLPQTGTYWSAWVTGWGQSGSLSLVNPANGARYDGLGLMDYSWAVPQSAGQIEFEEVRLYDGPLTANEIAALRYVGQSGEIKPVLGAGLRSIYDPALAAANVTYDWKLWGAVTVIDDDSFSIDDGSGVSVTVLAPGHGLENGNYVSVVGALDLEASPPTLTVRDIMVHQ